MERSLLKPPLGDSAHRTLDDQIESAIQSALTLQLGVPLRPGEAEGSQLRTVLRSVCVDARRRGIPVEQLLIAVKKACAAAPAIRARRSDSHAIQAIDRVVTVCIQEYYSSDGRSASEAAPPPHRPDLPAVR